MSQSPVLYELVIVFVAALAVHLVSHRLRVPSIIGFLLTGVLIGPYGLALVPDTERVEGFAELAVVLMLFVIGLEVSLAELRALGRAFFGGGGLQASVTATLASLIARACGAAWPVAIFVGLVITLSSTAIIVKLLGDRGELGAPHGRLSLGILLFQDLLIVPMLLIVPLLAGSSGLPLAAVLTGFVKGLGITALVFLLGRFLVPKILDLLGRTGIRELLLLAALAICLGSALLTHHLGLSMALGGFLSGVMLAESDLRHQIQSEIGPFRDVSGSIFFTSIGMLLSLSFVMAHLPAIVAATAAILIGKAAVIVIAARLLGFALRPALGAGFLLAQIGEFSFVLLGVARAEALVAADLYALLIAASVMTMLATPLFAALAAPLAARLGAASEPQPAGAEAEIRGHVVICGFGENGRRLARLLREGAIAYRIVEIDPATAKAARQAGEPVIFGDASRETLLRHGGIPAAAVAVISLSDPEAVPRTVSLCRRLNPKLHIVVRGHGADAIGELVHLGADEVVSEVLETSIELMRRVLDKLALPRHLIRSATRLLHEDNYRALRGATFGTELSQTMLDVLSAGTVETVALGAGHWASGMDIRQLDLRQQTGATILAVLRGERVHSHPSPDLRLAVADTLVLAGDHASMDAAIRLLEEERGEAGGLGAA